MLLIATNDIDQATSWIEILSEEYKLYQPFARDRRTLEILLKKVPIEIVLLDYDLLDETGINDISVIQSFQPSCKIILFSKSPSSSEEISAILFGAKAFCSKKLTPELLKKIIAKINEGELWVDRKFVTRLLKEISDITEIRHKEAVNLGSGIELLTPREKEIANLVATGAPNRRIANNLNISERTVKAHLGVIFRKLGITDRLQLALYMTKHKQLSGIWRTKGKNK